MIIEEASTISSEEAMDSTIKEEATWVVEEEDSAGGITASETKDQIEVATSTMAKTDSKEEGCKVA